MTKRNRWFAVLVIAALAVQLAGCNARPTEVESSIAEPSNLAESSGTLSEQPGKEELTTAESSEEESSESPVAAVEPGDATLVNAPPNTDDDFPEAPSVAEALTPVDIQVYIQDPARFEVKNLDGDEYIAKFAALINGAGPFNPGGSVQESAAPEANFLVVRGDYTKFFYALLPGGLKVDSAAYSISGETHDALKAAASFPTCTTYPQWMIYMNPNRITGATYNTADTRGDAPMTDQAIDSFAMALRNLAVVEGTGEKYSPGKESFVPEKNGSSSQFKLTFDSGVVYTITIKQSTMYLESSDMSFGCRYTVDDPMWVHRLVEIALYGVSPKDTDNDAINPNMGKPVIYLYPQAAQEVSVKLDFKGKLTYTFPDYRGGWNVVAQPDGTLLNKADGSTHYYLFWEGYSDRKSWDFSSGFVVRGSDVQAFFQEKLPVLGLVPREYNDFITYWTPELARNPYNLINFSTTEYEETAPLTVSPAPDTVLRVHMVYKALYEPVEVPEQTLPPAPARDGFTVVEWGGTRA